MLQKDLDTASAGKFAFFAARDARMKNYAGASNYTPAQKLRVERMKCALETCYYSKEVFVNYRKNFIAIKFADARVIRPADLKYLEDGYPVTEVEKRATAQGIVYRVTF